MEYGIVDASRRPYRQHETTSQLFVPLPGRGAYPRCRDSDRFGGSGDPLMEYGTLVVGVLALVVSSTQQQILETMSRLEPVTDTGAWPEGAGRGAYPRCRDTYGFGRSADPLMEYGTLVVDASFSFVCAAGSCPCVVRCRGASQPMCSLWVSASCISIRHAAITRIKIPGGG